MADKGLYHQQPCFCMPCRVMRKSGYTGATETKDSGETTKKKSRARKKS